MKRLFLIGWLLCYGSPAVTFKAVTLSGNGCHDAKGTVTESGGVVTLEIAGFRSLSGPSRAACAVAIPFKEERGALRFQDLVVEGKSEQAGTSGQLVVLPIQVGAPAKPIAFDLPGVAGDFHLEKAGPLLTTPGCGGEGLFRLNPSVQRGPGGGSLTIERITLGVTVVPCPR